RPCAVMPMAASQCRKRSCVPRAIKAASKRLLGASARFASKPSRGVGKCQRRSERAPRTCRGTLAILANGSAKHAAHRHTGGCAINYGPTHRPPRGTPSDARNAGGSTRSSDPSLSAVHGNSGTVRVCPLNRHWKSTEQPNSSSHDGKFLHGSLL